MSVCMEWEEEKHITQHAPGEERIEKRIPELLCGWEIEMFKKNKNETTAKNEKRF